MANYKTPGVYTEEIATLGSSIAGVPTAIAGFVGYTEKAVLPDGSSATNKPVRITSLLEFQTIFGGPKSEQFGVTLTDGVSGTIITVDATGLSNYILFYQVQMFYANGGGTCYVVSVGNYPAAINQTNLKDSLKKLEQIDEVTLLCVPESIYGTNDLVNTEMLKQAASLKDRFALMDTKHVNGNTILQDAQNFRDNYVGADNLKYGAAYYPALKTQIGYHYLDSQVKIVDQRTPQIYSNPNDKLSTVSDGVMTASTASTATIVVVTAANLATKTVTVNGVVITEPANFLAVTGDNNATATNLCNAINAMVPSVTATVAAATISLTAVVAGTVGNITIATSAVAGTITPTITNGTNGTVTIAPNKQLYNAISAELAKYTLELYPSASMAGVYARVDNERGVWKAPANVGLALVNGPSIDITDASQENLNVDSTSGKSINAIRKFTGRGTIVWGARTLAGNDNEWRYVNVRRLFNYVEESTSKATEFLVFEPNVANTWSQLKNMVEAFLNNLWQSGALAGAVPKDAYFVNVGLGTTMTAQDILEGKLIVEIGLAAVRPAEFIIIRYMHKLQES